MSDTVFFQPRDEILKDFANLPMDFEKGAGLYEYEGVGNRRDRSDYFIFFTGEGGYGQLKSDLQILYEKDTGHVSDQDDQDDLDDAKWEPFLEKANVLLKCGCYRKVTSEGRGWTEKIGSNSGYSCHRSILAGQNQTFE